MSSITDYEPTVRFLCPHCKRYIEDEVFQDRPVCFADGGLIYIVFTHACGKKYRLEALARKIYEEGDQINGR